MNEGSFVVMCSTWLNALVDEDDDKDDMMIMIMTVIPKRVLDSYSGLEPIPH